MTVAVEPTFARRASLPRVREVHQRGGSPPARRRPGSDSILIMIGAEGYVGKIALNPGISTSKARWISQPVASVMMITEPHLKTPSR